MLKPLNQVLLVKLMSFQKSKVDITTTEEDSERSLILGEVVEVSIESDGHPSSNKFKKGDIVVFGKYAYETFKFEGEDHYFVREDDIIAIKE